MITTVSSRMIKNQSVRLLQKIFTASLVIVSLSCSHAEQRIAISQDFRIGETYNYLVRKSIESDSIGRISTTTTSTSIKFTVLRIVKDLRECSWTYGSTVPLGINPDSLNDEAKKFLNYNEGLVVKFFIGKQGDFRGLNNLSECQAFLDSAYHRIFVGLGNKEKLEETMNKVIRPLYKTDEAFLSTFCQDVSALFGNFGDTLQWGKSISNQSSIRLPILDTEVSLVFTERIKNITDNIVTIGFEQKVSPEGYKSFIAGANNAVRKINDSQEEDKNIDMLYACKGILIYDTKKKAIIELSSQKTVHINEEIRTDDIKITLQE